MKLIKLTQDGKAVYVNPDNVLFLSPTTLINTTGVILIGGASLAVSGSLEETASAFEGKDTLSLTV